MKRYSDSFIFKTLLLATSLLLSATAEEISNPILANRHLDHVGFVVKDINATLDKWVEMIGIKNRPDIIIATGDAKNPTHYRGEPSKATAKLAFLALENVRIELIEPIGEGPSHWHEFLAKKGEGVHHFGFNIKDLGEKQLGRFEAHQYCAAQLGGWETGEYAYMDTHDSLGVTIELLEHYGE